MSEREKGTVTNVRTTDVIQDCPMQRGIYGQPIHGVSAILVNLVSLAVACCQAAVGLSTGLQMKS